MYWKSEENGVNFLTGGDELTGMAAQDHFCLLRLNCRLRLFVYLVKGGVADVAG